MTKTTRLKEVSKVKHKILEKYFRPWATILGSRHSHLVYVDCFAGEGGYKNGEPGSPLITLRSAYILSKKYKLELTLIFVEQNKKRAEQLEKNIMESGFVKDSVHPIVIPGDAQDITEEILKVLPRGIPTFFLIDPYGYPISVPIINEILMKPYTEVFLNLMWFRINMDLNNPKSKQSIDRMFGHSNWMYQSFMEESGDEKRDGFLSYFCDQISSKFYKDFRIGFSPEDDVRGWQKRTKYYLIHFCNHSKAAKLMKQIMWGVSEEEGTFDFSANKQGILFSRSPNKEELDSYIRKQYLGTKHKITFDQLQTELHHLPHIEKHFRSVIKELEKAKLLHIERIVSKKTGIQDRDIIIFD